jgi:hypothetical protein
LLRFLIRAKVSKRLSFVKATQRLSRWFAKPESSLQLVIVSIRMTGCPTVLSYKHWHSLKRGILVLVSPQAGELGRRISVEYPDLNVQPVEKTFSGWAAGHFEV